ncbi:hypothetical protein FHG87_017809 [Trinorchestia longiramus]|nr:hypothetical protein FHG87_017809 [Trinorchestia longiramus]
MERTGGMPESEGLAISQWPSRRITPIATSPGRTTRMALRSLRCPDSQTDLDAVPSSAATSASLARTKSRSDNSVRSASIVVKSSTPRWRRSRSSSKPKLSLE